jgi:hypothetical protein
LDMQSCLLSSKFRVSALRDPRSPKTSFNSNQIDLCRVRGYFVCLNSAAKLFKFKLY